MGRTWCKFDMHLFTIIIDIHLFFSNFIFISYSIFPYHEETPNYFEERIILFRLEIFKFDIFKRSKIGSRTPIKSFIKSSIDKLRKTVIKNSTNSV